MSIEFEPTICDVVRSRAHETPHSPALVAEDQAPLTYARLAGQMDEFREMLNGLGFGRNDRIALVGPNDAVMAALYLSVWGCATAVPLNPSLALGEFALYLRDLNVDALAVSARIDTAARAAAREIGLPIMEVTAIDGPVSGLFDISTDAPPKAAANPGPSRIDDTALVLITSGTTSHSKIVPSTHRNFINKVRITNATMGLAAADRCLNLMPLFHAGGLHGSLGGVWYTGGSVILLPDFSAERFFRTIQTLSPTWYTGASTFQHAIAAAANRHAGALADSRIRLIRVGAGPLDKELWDELERLFDAPVLSAYASTELGSISVVPMPPEIHKPGTVGRPSGLDVAIMSPDRGLLGPGERGEVVVKAEPVFGGYENDPAANREAFVDGWFRTGDEGMLDEDGYLTLTGRIKDVINRGGEKISPKEIDDALIGHPDVAAAATFPLPHATLGQEVAAAVVPKEDAVLGEEDLGAYLRDKLAAFKVPRKFVIAEDIPRDVNGKIQRRALAEAFGLAGTTPTGDNEIPARRAATPLEAKLQRLWADTLELDDVGLDDDFFLLGGDSLQAVDLFLRIEKDVGRRLPRSVLFEAGTVAKMARRIETSVPSSCVVPIQAKGERVPFFCVHDRSGEVLNFRRLAHFLGEDQPFHGIQSLGLEGDEPPFTSVEDMAAHYLAEVRKVQPEGPYLLGGYSLGGHVAYVMAQQLQKAGEEVALVALFDTYSNAGRRRTGVGTWLAHHGKQMVGLPARQLPGYLWLRLTNLAGMIRLAVSVKSFTLAWRYFESRGKPVPRALRRPVFANHMVLRGYQPEPYNGDVVLFKAERYAWSHADQHEGWKDLVNGRLTVVPLEGRHYDIFASPYVEHLADALGEAIARTRPNASAPRFGQETQVS